MIRISMRKILADLIGARLAPVVSREQVRRVELFGCFCRGLLDIGFGIRAPNTALEPTTTRSGRWFGCDLVSPRQFRRGSAFVR